MANINDVPSNRTNFTVDYLVHGGGSFGKNFTSNTLDDNTNEETESSAEFDEALLQPGNKDKELRAIQRFQAKIRGKQSRKRLIDLTEKYFEQASVDKNKTNPKEDSEYQSQLLAVRKEAARQHAERELTRLLKLSRWMAMRHLTWVMALSKFSRERSRVDRVVHTEGVYLGNVALVEQAVQANRDASAVDGTVHPELRKALEKCTEKEVEYVIEDTPSSKVPVELQGNLAMFSIEKLAERRALAKNSDILNSIKAMWDIENLKRVRGTSSNGAEFITETPYVDLLINFQYVMYPHPLDYATAKRNAEADWIADSGTSGPGGKLTEEQFTAAMFQLADTWSDATDPAEYVEILDRLRDGVTGRKKEIEKDQIDRTHKLLTSNSVRSCDWFSRAASKKYTKYKKMRSITCTNSGMTKLSKAALLVVIARIYNAKLRADDRAEERHKAYLPFDEFIGNYLVRQYGSTKFAALHLARIVESVEFLSAIDPRIHIFAKLAGIEVEPTSAEAEEGATNTTLLYDSSMISVCFLPVLRRVMDVQHMVKIFTGSSQTFCLVNSFLAAIAACSRHIPRDSPLFLRFSRAIRQMAHAVTPASTGTSASGKTGDTGAESATGGAQLTAQVQQDIAKTMSLSTVQRNGVLNLDEALLAAHTLWTNELEWRRLHNLAACCRASVHWQNMTWKGIDAKTTLPHVTVLSSFHVVANKTAKMSNNDVAQLSGAMKGARLVGLDQTRVVQLLSSQVEETDDSPSDGDFMQTVESLLEGSEEEGTTSTPRKKIEDARAIDDQVNGSEESTGAT